MSFYLSNTEAGPTGAEPLEFLDDPGLLAPTFGDEPLAVAPGAVHGRIEMPVTAEPARPRMLAAARLWFLGRRSR